ncbi:MAG: hypothetical protein ACI4V1_00915, partial [Eubacteriales bacterium]
MNRFSDAGSTPAVSIRQCRHPIFGTASMVEWSNPTRVEFIHCFQCSIRQCRHPIFGTASMVEW